MEETKATGRVVVEPEPVEPEQKKKTISLLSLQGSAPKKEEPVEPEVAAVVEEEPEEEKVIRTGSSVIIRRGDNLWRVARRNYGEGIRYTTIFEANRDQVRDPDLIYPGQVLKVPEAQSTSVESDQG